MRGRPRVGAQGNAPLAVAMLDVHADRLASVIDELTDEREREIEVTPFSYGELYSELSIALTQRSPKYDVVSLDDAWIPQFASFLTTVDLDGDMSDLIVPIAMKLSRYPDNADPCGHPWLGDSQFFATRPIWIAESGAAEPVTWDETVEAANSVNASLEAEQAIGGYAISTLSSQSLVESFLPVLRGCGTDLIDPETSVPQLDTPAALEAVTIFQQLANSGPTESAATGESSNIERFQIGDVAMMSNFWASSLLSTSEVETDRDSGPISCAMQPAQPGFERRSLSGVWIAGVPTGSEQPEQAITFLDWLLDSSTQRALLEVGLPPVLASHYGDGELVAAQPHLPELLDLLDRSTPRARSPYYVQLELLLATELEAMLEGVQSGQEAVRNANIAMREFLAREGVLEL